MEVFQARNKKGKDIKCKASYKEPVVSLAFKLQADPFAGMLTYLRVYSGVLKVGQALENTSSNRKERVAKILKMHANSRTETDVLKAGDIGAVVGLKWTKTGDTLCDRKSHVLLEPIGFPEPVISIAIEPKTSSDEKKTTGAFRKKSKVKTLHFHSEKIQIQGRCWFMEWENFT